MFAKFRTQEINIYFIILIYCCIKICLWRMGGARGSVVVKALCYKPEGRFPMR
jgi:hypothetical protein